MNKRYTTRAEAEAALPVIVLPATANYPYKIVGNKKTGYTISIKDTATYEDMRAAHEFMSC